MVGRWVTHEAITPLRFQRCTLLLPARPAAPQLRAADKSRLRARLASPLAPGGVGAQGPAAPDLRREVEVMRALDHPNLLNLYEVIEDRGGGKVRARASCGRARAGLAWQRRSRGRGAW